MRIVAPIPQQGGPRIPKNPNFLKNGKNHQNAKTQKRLEICQNQRYTLRPEVSHPSGSVVFNMFCKAKSAKKLFFFARRFQTASKQKCSNVRPLLSITSPQGFRISKNFGHPTSGSGSKNTFKRRMRIVAPIPEQGGPRIPQNPNFLKNGKNHPKCKNSKKSRDMPKLLMYPSTRGL